MTTLIDPSTPNSSALRDRLRAATIITDMVFVYEPPIGNDGELFQHYRAAGIDFIQCHPAGDDHNVSQAIQRIARLRRDIATRADCVVLERVADIELARSEGKLAVGIQLEGFRCLERNLDMIDLYYDLGVRLCHPIFNIVNSMGGGCTDGDTLGLTRFGRRVIERMNDVGMIVDGAHAGTRAQLDMIEHSRDPVVCSHHGMRALHPHARNLTDEVTRACAARGGVVGLTGAGYYLGGRPDAERLFAHVDHAVQLVGAEHVGRGLDWTADTARLEAAFLSSPDVWGPIEDWLPVEFFGPQGLWDLVERIANAGYAETEIAGIIGANWMRIARTVWK